MPAVTVGVATWGVRRIINAISGSDKEVVGIFDVFTSGTIVGNILSWKDARGSAGYLSMSIATSPPPLFNISQMAVSGGGAAWMATNSASALNCANPVSIAGFATAPVPSTAKVAFGISDNSNTSAITVENVGGGNWGYTDANNADVQIAVLSSAVTYRTVIASITGGASSKYQGQVYSHALSSTVQSVLNASTANCAIVCFNYASHLTADIGPCLIRGIVAIKHTTTAGENASLGQYGVARYGCVTSA